MTEEMIGYVGCCACIQCGEPMLLGWQKETGRYGALCIECSIFSPLSALQDTNPNTGNNSPAS
jgi:hypothetical protein